MSLGSESVRRHDLTIAVLLPPVAWSAYFLIVYPATSTVCDLASVAGEPLMEGAVYAGAIVLTLVTCLMCAAGGFVSWRRLRQSGARRGAANGLEGDPHAFLAYLGVLMGVFFVVATVFLALPIAIVGGPCR